MDFSRASNSFYNEQIVNKLNKVMSFQHVKVVQELVSDLNAKTSEMKTIQ